MLKWWEYIDFTSAEPSLYFKGKKRYTSKFGCFVSSFSIIIITIFTIIFSITYLNKTDINLFYQIEDVEFNSKMDLNNKPFFFRLKDTDTGNADPRMAVVIAEYFSFTNGKYSKVILETEQCSIERHFPNENYKENIKNLDINTYTCFKNNVNLDLNLKSDIIKNEISYIKFYINRCTNSTINNNTCYEPNILSKKLAKSNFNFEYFFPGFSINHYNISNPIQEKINFYSKKMYPNMFYEYIEKIKIVNYTADNGIFLENMNSWTMFGRDPLSYIEISNKGPLEMPDTFAIFQIILNTNNMDVYKRSFPKLQNIIANIGGLIKFIMSISIYITEYITSQYLDIELSNYFINTDVEEDKKLINYHEYNMTIKPLSCITIPSNSFILYNVNNLNRKISSRLNDLSPCNFNPRRISFIEALLPKKCLNFKSYKKWLKDYRKIIRSKISTEQILKLCLELENVKYLMLDEDQYKAFDYMKFPTLENHLKKLNSGNWKIHLPNLRIENLLQKRDCKINKKLVQRIINKSFI